MIKCEINEPPITILLDSKSDAQVFCRNFCLYFQELLTKEEGKNENRSKLIQKTLKRQTKLNEEFMKSLMNDETTNEMYNTWLNSKRSSNLEKLHFIIGHGIIRKELR